ncbi:helix-turn-helix transcriptional regulator [Chloroflexota bacterium]
MRADRLLSLLILLQTRGRMTARRLAEELEVSERTIYRDIDALSAAGVPVYTERGPGGGCALLDGYRTNLTGLTRDEVRALFMLNVPAPLADLGVDHELKAALLKLSAALPSERRTDEGRMRERIHLDSIWWFQHEEPVPHLQTIQEAVWEDRRLQLRYRLPFQAEAERVVDPYGLVAKAGVWYLVCASGGHVRVHRASHVLGARLVDGSFERPPGFDLAEFWKAWSTSYEQNRSHYPVTARVAPSLHRHLPQVFGDAIRDTIAKAAPPDPEGWLTLILPFESFEAARGRILGFGRAVEVLEPVALRDSVLDFAIQVVALYER